MKLPRVIGDYVFVPKGETVRAFEAGAIIVVLQLAAGLESVTDWKAWALGGVGALATFTIGFIKGHTSTPMP